MHKYNHYFPDDSSFESLAADREQLLKNVLGKVGEGVFIEPPLYLDYGCNVSIGQRFYAGFKYVDVTSRRCLLMKWKSCHPRLWYRQDRRQVHVWSQCFDLCSYSRD